MELVAAEISLRYEDEPERNEVLEDDHVLLGLPLLP